MRRSPTATTSIIASAGTFITRTTVMATTTSPSQTPEGASPKAIGRLGCRFEDWNGTVLELRVADVVGVSVDHLVHQLWVAADGPED
jgi:hypothetical protein